jgi:hypothetical protein
MASKNVMKVEITPASQKYIDNVYKYVSMLPNRIKAAETLTAAIAARKVSSKIKNKYGPHALYSFDIFYDLRGGTVVLSIESKGKGSGYRPTPKGKYHEDKVMGWIIKFTGRRAFTSQQNIVYNTRPKSRGKYGKSRRSFSVPRQPKDMNYVRDIRRLGNLAASEAVSEAFAKYGFGPRGGASKLKDLSAVRVRSIGGSGGAYGESAAIAGGR